MIDSPQALITQQVESGVVVRMAVLYELLAGAARPRAASASAATEPDRAAAAHERAAARPRRPAAPARRC